MPPSTSSALRTPRPALLLSEGERRLWCATWVGGVQTFLPSSFREVLGFFFSFFFLVSPPSAAAALQVQEAVVPAGGAGVAALAPHAAEAPAGPDRRSGFVKATNVNPQLPLFSPESRQCKSQSHQCKSQLPLFSPESRQYKFQLPFSLPVSAQYNCRPASDWTQLPVPIATFSPYRLPNCQFLIRRTEMEFIFVT